MQGFTFYNPTRIVLGRDALSHLDRLVPPAARVLLTYGGGSIKANGVYERVREELGDRHVVELAGIEPNPDFETLMRGVEHVREERLDFLLAVGGGSVLDGTKFIAAAARWEGDPWRIFERRGADVRDALPLGAVLTLPATGSEANGNSVVSRRATGEKVNFASEHVFPRFSLLDPETTFSLPARQLRNGLADAFVHACEQYLTYPAAAPLQDRQAEAVLSTLVEISDAVLADPPDPDARATFLWAATNALNTLIGCGVPQDWATHMIGHELTAIYGLDHAQTLVIVLPGVLRHELRRKEAKLAQVGRRVFQVEGAQAAIERIEGFFRDLGLATTFGEHGIDATEAARLVRERLEARGVRLGEHRDLEPAAVEAILRTRA